MLRLRPYKPCDGAAVASWCKSEYAYYQWCADHLPHYGFTAGELNAQYAADGDNPNVWVMTAFTETEIVGQLSMRFVDEGKRTLRFGLVIVNDTLRGKGYGREMLRLAAEYAFELLGVEKIQLGVFCNNTAAVNCYASVGFRKLETVPLEKYTFLGKCWDCMTMELRRPEPPPR